MQNSVLNPPTEGLTRTLIPLPFFIPLSLQLCLGSCTFRS